MKEYKLTINNNSYTVVIKDVTDDAVLAEVNGKQHVLHIDNTANLPQIDDKQVSIPISVPPAAPSLTFPKPSTPVATSAGNIVTPIPGQIISIDVTVGEKVRLGQKLLVLEAMKLENSITATINGTVDEILVTEGSVVGQGQTLIILS